MTPDDVKREAQDIRGILTAQIGPAKKIRLATRECDDLIAKAHAWSLESLPDDPPVPSSETSEDDSEPIQISSQQTSVTPHVTVSSQSSTAVVVPGLYPVDRYLANEASTAAVTGGLNGGIQLARLAEGEVYGGTTWNGLINGYHCENNEVARDIVIQSNQTWGCKRYMGYIRAENLKLLHCSGTLAIGGSETDPLDKREHGFRVPYARSLIIAGRASTGLDTDNLPMYPDTWGMMNARASMMWFYNATDVLIKNHYFAGPEIRTGLRPYNPDESTWGVSTASGMIEECLIARRKSRWPFSSVDMGAMHHAWKGTSWNYRNCIFDLSEGHRIADIDLESDAYLVFENCMVFKKSSTGSSLIPMTNTMLQNPTYFRQPSKPDHTPVHEHVAIA